MSEPSSLVETLRAHLATPTSSFSIGSFGAIAEFHRRLDESAAPLLDSEGNTDLGVLNARGGLRVTLRPETRGLAYETLSRDGRRWQHGVAVVLPQDIGRSSRRRRLTPLGPDAQAIRPKDRQSLLFDMGLGARNIDFLVRTADPELIRILEGAAGIDLLAPEGHRAMGAIVEASPHRIAVSALGRLEVYQAIGRDRTPEGPHTHVLPKFLRSGRTHSANIPVPPGWLPGLTLHPASAVSDENGRPIPFDPARQAVFDRLREIFSDPQALATRGRVLAALQAGGRPPSPESLPADRHLRTAARVAVRQWHAQDARYAQAGQRLARLEPRFAHTSASQD